MTYRSVVLGQSPIAYFNLDEVSGSTYANTQGSGDGTDPDAAITQGVTPASGLEGTAITFGAGHTIFADITGIPTGTGDVVTVTGWIKWDGTAASPKILWGWDNATDIIFFTATEFGFNTGSGDCYGFNPTGIIVADTWTHLAVVYYNNQSYHTANKIYVNGVNQTLIQAEGVNGSIELTERFWLSGWGAGSTLRYPDSMDEVAVFDRELNSTEIMDEFTASEPFPGGFGQAQTDVKAVGRGFAQAQTDIVLPTGKGFGQSQADIKVVSRGFAQAQTNVSGVDAPTYRDNVLAQTPLAYFRLDETSGTNYVNDQGTGDGTGDVGIVQGITAIQGTGISFDTSPNTITATITGMPSGTGDAVTITGWINWNGNASDNQAFWGWNDYDCVAFLGNTIFGFFYDSLGSCYGFDPTGIINPGEWTHIAVVYYNDQDVDIANKIYVNGVEQTLSLQFGSIVHINITPEIFLSGEGSFGSNYFYGGMDEVAYFDRELSGSEILDELDFAPPFPGGFAQAQAQIFRPPQGYGQAQVYIHRFAGFGQAQAHISVPNYIMGLARVAIKRPQNFAQAQVTIKKPLPTTPLVGEYPKYGPLVDKKVEGKATKSWPGGN